VEQDQVMRRFVYLSFNCCRIVFFKVAKWEHYASITVALNPFLVSQFTNVLTL